MVDTIELLSEEQGKIHDRIDIDKLHQGGADGQSTCVYGADLINLKKNMRLYIYWD